MASFSSQELADIVLMYGECRHNIQATRRLYQDRFPQRRQPSRQTVLSTVQRLRDTGSVIPSFEGRGRERPQRILQAEDAILELMDEDPTLSTNDIARQVEVSQSTVHQILQQNLLHPCNVQRVQHLKADDLQARLEFCSWVQQKRLENPEFSRNVLFTNECCFTRDGILNYWSDVNPHEIQRSRHQRGFSINVWCGIFGDNLYGPYVLPTRLNGHSYLHFLEGVLPDLLEDVPLQVRREMFFMHDGAPSHIALPVRTFLNTLFPERWLGSNGPVPWPHRSPDLNPLDYFLYGHMKSVIYKTEVDDIDDLQQRVFAVAADITPDVLVRVCENFNRRIDACILADGNHFEQWL
ncbi:hypothetical protein NQ317_014636 [Molorchus minor]|uniref:Transposase n=1 Tax=Molorchus minor TaxID=1323400 RepID=A0ABQ9JQF1_9CUCU|nr:hypothetical protein NQ317_014636 [Molorchus minor]